MYVFIGQKVSRNRLKTKDGYFLTFENELNWYDDKMYAVLCTRNEETKLFKYIKRADWKEET